MKVDKIDPIRIQFDGLDADSHLVELGTLATSLQGASKLLASGGQVALLGKFSKKDLNNTVRVLALPPQPGSYEIWVILAALGGTAVAPLLPYIDVAVRTAATKVTEALVNATIARWAGRAKEAETANNVAVRALEEMGHTARSAMQMAERVAMANLASTRQLVSPIGLTAQTMQIGHADSGAFQITLQDRQEIGKSEPIDIGDEQVLSVRISELDLVTKTCKVSLVAEDYAGRRISGQITDPQILVPNNPYSTAFDSQTPLFIKCKPQYADGELDRLYISDIAHS